MHDDHMSVVGLTVPPMRALITARVSLDRIGRSVAEQVEVCRAWADREGWTVAAVIEETGSASRYARSTGARTHWDEIVTWVASGKVDILLTWEASRATRQMGQYAELAEVLAQHQVLWGYSGTVYDLATREGRFRTGLDALLAQDESDRTSERIRRSTRARARAGLPHGKIPFGYMREYDPHTRQFVAQLPDPDTAPVVQEIFTRIADGDTLYAVAADLTARAVPMPRPARTRHQAAAWIPTTLRRIIDNPAYAGLRVYQGEVIGDAAWDPIVSRDLQQRAQAAVQARPVSNPAGDSTARWLLSGIARCRLCMGPMRALNNRGTRRYTCASCFKVARRVEPVDEHVRDRVLALLTLLASTAPAGILDDPATPPAVSDAQAHVDALERRLEGFIAGAVEGAISPATLARIEGGLLAQIRTAKTQLRALQAPSRLRRYDLSDPAALWEAMTIAQRRQLLRDGFTVTIAPAPRRGSHTFDPTLVDVEPTW
jgi:site-specific DNA recombinase